MAASVERCPVCNRSQLVEISMTAGGESVRMRSCSACDSRWWNMGGSPVKLPQVLEAFAAAR